MQSASNVTPRYYVRFRPAECTFIYHHPLLTLTHCFDFLPICDPNKSIISKAVDANGNFFAIKWLEGNRSSLLKDKLLTYQKYVSVAQPSFLVPALWVADLITLECDGQLNNFDGIVMPWVTGDTLAVALVKSIRIENKRGIAALYVLFKTLLVKMKANPNFVHGGLHANNIIVHGDNLVLVDYDTAYTETPQNKNEDVDCDTTLYHPQKSTYTYHINTDQFPALCLLITLYAGSKDPQLAEAFLQPNGTIFREEDLSGFASSPVAHALKQLKDKQLNNFVQLLQVSLLNQHLEVPELLYFITAGEPENLHQKKLATLLAQAKEQNKLFKKEVKKDAITTPAIKAATPLQEVDEGAIANAASSINNFTKVPLAKEGITNSKPASNRNRKKIVIAISIVAILSILGEAAYFLSAKKSTPSITIMPINTITDTLAINKTNGIKAPAAKKMTNKNHPASLKNIARPQVGTTIKTPTGPVNPIVPNPQNISINKTASKQVAVQKKLSPVSNNPLKTTTPFIKNNSKPKKQTVQKPVVFKKLDL